MINPAAPSSSPKHTISAFFIYSICAIFAMLKERKKPK